MKLRIRTLFFVVMVLTGAVSSGLAVSVVVEEGTAYRRVAAGENLAGVYVDTIKAIQVVLTERASTIFLLGVNAVTDAEARAPMIKAREAVDAKISDLRNRVGAGGLDGDGAIAAALEASASGFRALRSKVDDRLNMPTNLRAPGLAPEVAIAIDMVNGFESVLDLLGERISKVEPERLPMLSVARAIVAERLIAGVLTTKLGPQLELNTKLSTDELLDIQFWRGKTFALNDALLATIARSARGSALDRAMQATQKALFVDGWGMFDRLVAEGREGKPYDTPVKVYSPTIVAALNTLWPARDAAFEMAEAQGQALLANAESKLSFALAALSAIFVTVAGSIWIFRRRLIQPLTKLTGLVTQMSEGARDLAIPYTTKSDELGELARGLEHLQDVSRVADDLRAEAAHTETQNASRVQAARAAIADQFQSRMGALASSFANSSREVSEAARTLSTSAQETAREAQTVLGAAEAASGNVQTVAAATEEMTASIREIAGQVAQSAEIANVASDEAMRTEADVRALSEAASKIGEVVALINSIAGQTNLLALNATIEAARAGEAGRGFAVVASEVKQLASQTAKATEEIGSKIAEIQSATSRTVGSIDRIVHTVAEILAISTSVASAVRQQGTATDEIAANTNRAADGTGSVTASIQSVGRAAEGTGTASNHLLGLAAHLSGEANELQREVGDFVRQLRAGT